MLIAIRWLLSLGSFWLFCVVSVTLVSLAIAAPYVRRRLFREVAKETSSGASAALAAIVTFSVFILGSSLSTVQTNMSKLDATVVQEASVISVMNGTLASIEPKAAAELRRDLSNYVDLLVKDEWPAMQHDGRSAKADAALISFAAKIDQAPINGHNADALATELQKNLDSMSDLREERLSHTGLGLSSLYWGMIVTLLTLLIFLASFVECTHEQMLKSGGIMFALSLFVGLIVTFECPFNGDTSIHPVALERALETIRDSMRP